MNILRLKSKSQLTIPKKIRKKLGIEPGDYLRIDEEKGKIILTPQVMVPKGKESKLSKKGEKHDEILN